MTQIDIAALVADREAGTKGPWNLDGPVWNQIIWTDAENRICFMAHSNGLNDARDLANARRIARVPDLEAALIEQAETIKRLTARAEAAEALLAAATGMVSIVEGMDGVMNHGVWRDEGGMRLKDTPEWVSLYNAHAAMKEGR